MGVATAARRGRHAAEREAGPSASRAPLLVVALAVLFGLVVLFPETRDVWSLNDASIHASMTRWAAERIRAGHLPFDGWYPYLSLGASRFHHYQSLPHITTGLLSILFGPATFRWSLFLLLACWPVAVYAGGRLFGLGRWPCALAALAAPLLASQASMGFEWGSYVWRGSGAWAQLWGMWALPFAWALSWRAVSGRGPLWLAALVVGITVCVHLLTGYLALLTLGVWVLIAPRDLWRRLARAAAVGAGALLVSAWMLVPLLTDATWTTQDEFSRGTYFYDSFGAPKVLRWLVTGGLFDRNRVPVLTVLFGVGLVVAAVGARRQEAPRAILGAGTLSLLLFFGRPTLGAVIDALPGGSDLFLRRYLTGVHLAGVYLIGLGAMWIAGVVHRWWASRAPATRRWIPAAAAAGAIVLALLPAWVERVAYERKGTAWIDDQASADAVDGAAFAALVDRARRQGPGRIYSSLRSNGALEYRIGQVPTFVALLDLDADAVGFTRPTWSVLSGVEHRFRLTRRSDPVLFGVRYAILPAERLAPPGFAKVAESGRHVLWERDDVRYVHVVRTIAPVAADRTNLGKRMTSVLDADLSADGIVPLITFAGHGAPVPDLAPHELPSAPAGTVTSETDAPAEGAFEADVEMAEAGTVDLASSFDPRWEATVDGSAAPTVMVAPGTVAVHVEAGPHHVAFRYAPYPLYALWFALIPLTIAALWFVDHRSASAALRT